MINQQKRFLFIMMIAIGGSVFSQTTKKSNHEWRFILETNLLLPKAEGETGVSYYPAIGISQKASDIYNHISYGGMYTFEARNDTWVIAADFIYSSLDASAKENILVRKGKVNADQFFGNLSILRKITPWLDAGIGGTLVNVKAGFDASVINPLTGQLLNLDKSISRTWFDPMIIARTTSSEKSKFIYFAKAGIGGFGVASKLTWQAEALAGYRFSKIFFASLGYKAVSFNYKKGNNENAFLYDMTISGPILKLGFNMDQLF